MPYQKEIKNFIYDLFQKINSVSDFALVDKCYSEKAWKDVFELEKVNIMNNETIKQEYQKKFNRYRNSETTLN